MTSVRGIIAFIVHIILRSRYPFPGFRGGVQTAKKNEKVDNYLQTWNVQLNLRRIDCVEVTAGPTRAYCWMFGSRGPVC